MPAEPQCRGSFPELQKCVQGDGEEQRDEKVLLYCSLSHLLFLYFPRACWLPLPFSLHLSEVPEVPNSVLESLWHWYLISVPSRSAPLTQPHTPFAAPVLVHKSILHSGFSGLCSANSAKAELAPQPLENWATWNLNCLSSAKANLQWCVMVLLYSDGRCLDYLFCIKIFGWSYINIIILFQSPLINQCL